MKRRLARLDLGDRHQIPREVTEAVGIPADFLDETAVYGWVINSSIEKLLGETRDDE